MDCYMKFRTDCYLKNNNSHEIKFPNLTKQCKVPILISVSETVDNNEVPATNIMCRVTCGGTDIGSFNEPSFRLSNEIDLTPFKGVIDRSGKVSVLITNRSGDHKNLTVHCTYTDSYGTVITEERLDHFEKLLADIHSRGFCTRLILMPSRKLDSLEFASTAECVEGIENWIQPFDVACDKDLDAEDQTCNIDFSSKDLGRLYSENLNFLELRANAPKIEGAEPLQLYAIAYGFPK